jgi:gluconolactonase
MILRSGVRNPEGPVSLPDGSWIFTEMDAGVISHINANGQMLQELVWTGKPNGLAVDASGNIWVAEAKQRSLLKVTLAGEIHKVSKGSKSLPFLLPNDLCFGPDGAIYMTDSGILHEEMRAISNPMAAYDLSFNGHVFRVDPKTDSCTWFDQGLRLTNGIAFDSTGDYLYVAETITGNIYRYRIDNGQVLGTRELFGNVMIKPPQEFGRIAGPDGMAFDVEGNLYVAVLIQGDITVLDPSGKVKKRIPLEGNLPTNLAFDRNGKPFMLVTEASRGELLLIETEYPGLPLYK